MKLEKRNIQPAPKAKTIIVSEPAYYGNYLRCNEFSLCVTWHFRGPSGRKLSNICWKTFSPRPNIHIRWRPGFALNWVTSLPKTNFQKLRPNGEWQPCAAGESFDIDSGGFWTKSSSDPKKGFMMVGNNGYDFGSEFIYLVIGVRDDSKEEYSPVRRSLSHKGTFVTI